MPRKRATVPLDRAFTVEEMRLVRRGVIPRVMEDKWFVYWQDNALHFHRSWTGYCLYVVRFARSRGTWRTVEADINRDPKQYSRTDDAEDARMISYLVDVLLLRGPAEFPAGDRASDDNALACWSFIGRAMLDKHPDGRRKTASLEEQGIRIEKRAPRRESRRGSRKGRES